MGDFEAIIRLLAIISVTFLAGMWLGVKIINRRKKALEEAVTGLGYAVNEIIDQTTGQLRFIGYGARVTRQIIIQRNGVNCRITFEAEYD